MLRQGKPPLTLSVFIDGLGWELLRNRPFLDEILTTRAPLQTVFGYSCTCCPTILTGKMPREHGHLSFFYYDPQSSPFAGLDIFKRLPHTVSKRGRVRRLLSKWMASRLGFTGYFQLYNVPFDRLRYFDYLEKDDIYEEGGIVNGNPTIFDWLRELEIPFHKGNWRHSEEANLASLESALGGGDLRFAWLYLPALDAILHAHGTNAEVVNRKISWYETKLRRIIAIARRTYDVSVVLFSDHGMTNIVDQCDLISRIEKLGLEFGTDYAAMYDSTMARFWFLRPSARDAILGALSQEKRGEVLSERQLAQHQVDFPDRRYGEAFFLLKPGVLLCPSYMGEKPMKGMHGFRPDHPDATAVFATNIEPAPRPYRLDDLYSVMQADVAVDLQDRVVC